MTEQNEYTPLVSPTQTTSPLRELFDKYLNHWKWFILGALLSLVGAYSYIRYAVKLYEVKASVLIKDNQGGNIISEFSAFQDLGIVDRESSLENEIEILKSRDLMTLVVEELNLNIQYVVDLGPIQKEYYRNKPFNLNFLAGDSSIYNTNTTFKVKVLSKTDFAVYDVNDVLLLNGKFGNKIHSPAGDMIITPTSLTHNIFTGKLVKIIILPKKAVVDHYQKQIVVQPINANANVIDIRLVDPSFEKGIDIVNTLIKKYNADAINEKNLVSSNTAKFINERIVFVTRELSDVESTAEEFKTDNHLVDVASEAGLFLSEGSEIQKELLQTSTQLRLVEYMYDYVKTQNNDSDLIPTNVGITDESIVSMTDMYNKLLLERNRLIKNSSDKNPVIINLDNQLLSIRHSLNESLNNAKVSLSFKVKSQMRQDDLINARIASVPKYEREYRIIQRQQQIKESLYLYLLQKREETGLSLAGAVANAKVIDAAYCDQSVVSPKKKMVYAIALFSGLLVVISIIYLRGLFDTKVNGKIDIEALSIPYLGDVPKTDYKEYLIVKQNDNSTISEALRLIRTNLSFMMGPPTGQAKMLFVTSTISSEGKSFITVNLAATYALSDKRVLIIGMDLRAPKIIEYLGLTKSAGVTNYITNPELTVADLLMDVPGFKNLKLITSGPIPPNPAELLVSGRVKELFDEVKQQFDIVIVDTSPIGLVADTLLLTEYADLFLYVVRNRYLDKRMLSIPENLFREGRIKKMAILLNCVDQKRDLGYGYGYGYGYGQNAQRTTWQKFFGRKRK